MKTCALCGNDSMRPSDSWGEPDGGFTWLWDCERCSATCKVEWSAGDQESEQEIDVLAEAEP